MSPEQIRGEAGDRAQWFALDSGRDLIAEAQQTSGGPSRRSQAKLEDLS